MKESTYYGIFFGAVKTTWLPDHPRNMRLIERVTFRDRRHRQWVAEKESVINGASTGWFLRRLFPAYVGRYRRATVLHDCYCEKRTAPSWRVHRMFREAMLADGTSLAVAWILWAGVRLFGPRFSGRCGSGSVARDGHGDLGSQGRGEADGY